MGTIGLYYPFIHFKDDDWLRLSALYWDKMARIVPPSYSPNPHKAVLSQDSEATRELADLLDFIVNISPGEASHSVSELFGGLILDHAEQLRSRFDIAKADEWPVDAVTAQYAQLRNPHLAYVNFSKLSPELLSRMEEASLAQSHQESGEQWAGMHPRMAFVYMSALAEEAAALNGLNPTTDETLDHIASRGWSLPRLASVLLEEPRLSTQAELGQAEDDSGGSRPHEEQRASLALLSIRTVVPEDPGRLTVEKIAEVREEFGPELFRFQRFVDQVAGALPQLDARADPSAVTAHLQIAYDQHVGPLLRQLQQALRGRGVDTVEAAMGTSIDMPAALSPISVDHPISFGVAAVLSLVPVLRAKRRQARETYMASPASYLYRLDQELQPRTLLGWLGQRTRAFLTGV